jgi:RNA polymerase sigma-70 factor (ECF subfamily)
MAALSFALPMASPDTGTGARVGTDPGDAVAVLVARARDGDEVAFRAIYARFHRAVHAVALARLEPRDAEDLVQDVFVEAWRKLDDLREPAAFPGWLLRLARNRTVDRVRRRVVVEPLPEQGAEAPPYAEARAALLAIRSLPEAYHETLIMRLVEGMTGPEIAERTGMRPDSVRVNLHRGFALLRQRLGADP